MDVIPFTVKFKHLRGRQAKWKQDRQRVSGARPSEKRWCLL